MVSVMHMIYMQAAQEEEVPMFLRAAAAVAAATAAAWSSSFTLFFSLQRLFSQSHVQRLPRVDARASTKATREVGAMRDEEIGVKRIGH